jgi:hypothetical protein
MLITGDVKSMHDRANLLAERVRQLGDLFGNPNPDISEAELYEWIMAADRLHNDLIAFLTDSVRFVHTGGIT